jgi:hypothetical protein
VRICPELGQIRGLIGCEIIKTRPSACGKRRHLGSNPAPPKLRGGGKRRIM